MSKLDERSKVPAGAGRLSAQQLKCVREGHLTLSSTSPTPSSPPFSPPDSRVDLKVDPAQLGRRFAATRCASDRLVGWDYYEDLISNTTYKTSTMTT